MAVTIVIVAILVALTLLTLTAPADTAVKNSLAMAARKNQDIAVEKNRAMAVRSLLAMVVTLADTVVPKASSMVVSALSDLMALLVSLVDSVEKRKSTARGGRSTAQVAMVAPVDMVAPADTATRVTGDGTKYDVSLAGHLMLMCCARSTLLTPP